MLSHALLLLLIPLTLGQEFFPTLTLLNGTVRGRKISGNCEAFLGVPYAASPTGALRFETPRPPSAWPGVFLAANYAPSCPQPVGPRHFLSQSAPISEDCLTLNVFMPPISSHSNPVLFWVHGGGFFYGTSATLQPRDICAALVSQGIIVVTLHYRLGPLGFLDPSDGSVPRNLGIRDQIQALHWVRENIGRFGGDPDRITAAGHGSGAATVSAISLSQKGLINSLILMSGSILAPWAVTNHSRGSTQALSRSIRCPSQSTTVECLRRVPWRDLISLSPELWSPVVDGAEGVIEGQPRAILSSGSEESVPVMAGVNRDEAAFLVIQKLLSSGSMLSKELFTEMLVPDFATDFLHSQREPLLDALELQYFPPLDPTKGGNSLFDYLDSAIQLYTDFLYRSPLLLEAALRSAIPDSSVFLYSYENPSGVELANSPGWRGAPHGLDLLDLWGPGSVKAQQGNFRITGPLTSVLGPLFAAFVKNQSILTNRGRWEKFTETSPNVLRIGNRVQLRTEDLQRRMHFWSEFIPGLIETLQALRNPFVQPGNSTQDPVRAETTTEARTTSGVTYKSDDSATEPNKAGEPMNQTVIFRSGPIPENRTVLWIMVSLALVFFMMFLLTAGGCAAWHRQSYQMPNTKSRHQDAEIRIPRIPERPPTHRNGHPHISVPRIPHAPPPPIPATYMHDNRPFVSL